MIGEKEREYAELLFTLMYKAAQLENISNSDAYLIAKKCSLIAIEMQYNKHTEIHIENLYGYEQYKKFINNL